MRHVFALCLVLVTAGTANAACYADYKAKQDDPLQLHYGVVQLANGNGCPAMAKAERQVARRIGSDGWQLLTVMSLSTQQPTDRQRSNAGQYFLRY